MQSKAPILVTASQFFNLLTCGAPSGNLVAFIACNLFNKQVFCWSRRVFTSLAHFTVKPHIRVVHLFWVLKLRVINHHLKQYQRHGQLLRSDPETPLAQNTTSQPFKVLLQKWHVLSRNLVVFPPQEKNSKSVTQQVVQKWSPASIQHPNKPTSTTAKRTRASGSAK